MLYNNLKIGVWLFCMNFLVVNGYFVEGDCIEHEEIDSKLVNCSKIGLNYIPDVSIDATILDLSKNQIQNLTGLDEYQHLTKLILSENNITQVEIPRLFYLTQLDLSNNNISKTEDLHQKTESLIEELNLNNNQIKTLDNKIFQKNVKLKKIYLNRNPINVIKNLSSQSLEELHLNEIHSQFIKQDALTELTNLKKLLITNNSNFMKLSRENQLNLKKLEVLNVSYCSISKIEINELVNLIILDMSHNRLQTIKNHSFEMNRNISEIYLSSNLINSIAFDSFKNNQQLKYLDLSNNKINMMSWSVHLNSLITLNMSSNQIKHFLNLNLTNVKVLDLSYNEINISIQNFNKMLPKLTNLNLAGNKIKNITRIESLTLLSLDLSSCKITLIEEEAFREATALKFLDLSDNKLKRLLFVKYLLKLNKLKLEDNAWECSCSDESEISLLRNTNITLARKIICVPHNIPWTEFCKKVAKVEVDEPRKSAKVEWIVAVLVVLILIVAVATGLVIRRKLVLKKQKEINLKNKRPSVDLLETTPTEPKTYQYSYVSPPLLEEVELRRSLGKKSAEMDIMEEAISLHSQRLSDILSNSD